MDFLVVGAGIIGLALAWELRKRLPGSRIVILEKEKEVGQHASGRNSGVLHSGVFYAEDSLKARFSAEGARELGEFCSNRRLPLFRCGKVVVPTRPGDEERLAVLYERGKANGAEVHWADPSDLSRIEPEAYSFCGKALYLPQVSVVDPRAVVKALARELREKEVEILFEHPLERVENIQVVSREERFSYGHLLNAAGLYADRVAHFLGAGLHHAILPFKGLYYHLAENSGLRINGLIYAVPDFRVPFLGIHYGKTPEGETFLGPTVIPALGRENYHGLEHFRVGEAARIVFQLMQLYLHNQQGFRTLVHREAPRFLKRSFFEAARAMTPKLKLEHLEKSSRVGIRAQLVDLKKGQLIMDFLVEHHPRSSHILNAVSPAFTSALPFARLVLDQAGIR